MRLFNTRRARCLRDGGAGSDPATGGTTTGGGGTTTAPAGTPATGASSDEHLGEGGKAALDRERAAARDASRQKTAAEQRADAAEAELAKVREANQSEAEKATAKAVKDATDAVTETANKRLVRAEVKAVAAAVGFHDPRDAALLLADSFGQIKVGTDGQVDEAAVKALVDGLAKDKPHLVKTAGAATVLPGQGSTGGSAPTGKEAGMAEARRRFGEPSKTT